MLRDMMIANMITHIGNPNGCSRYGRVFYRPKEEVTRRERKFNARSKIIDNKINIDTLHELDDNDLLQAYDRFSQRFYTWM